MIMKIASPKSKIKNKKYPDHCPLDSTSDHYIDIYSMNIHSKRIFDAKKNGFFKF